MNIFEELRDSINRYHVSQGRLPAYIELGHDESMELDRALMSLDFHQRPMNWRQPGFVLTVYGVELREVTA